MLAGVPLVTLVVIVREHAVRHVTKGLLAESDILIEIAGFQNIKQINRAAIDSLPVTACLIVEASKR